MSRLIVVSLILMMIMVSFGYNQDCLDVESKQIQDLKQSLDKTKKEQLEIQNQIVKLKEKQVQLEKKLQKETSRSFDRNSYKLTCKLTAYSGGQLTKIGTNARTGIVAVDPNVIPLRSKIHIEGMGYFTSEDTGGNVKGNWVDVFMNSRSEALEFGVKNREVTVYVK